MKVRTQAKIPGQLLGRLGTAIRGPITLTAPAGPLPAGRLAEKRVVGGVITLSGMVFLAILGVGPGTGRRLCSAGG